MEKFFDNFNLIEFIQRMISIEFLTRILFAVLIFLAVWLLGRLLLSYLFKVLLKFSRNTETNLDNQIVKAFKKPSQLLFFFLGVYFALLYLPLNPGYDILASKLFRSTLIVLLAMGTYKFVGNHIVLSEEIEKIFNAKLDKILVPFFSKAFRIIIVLLAVVIIAQEWNYDVNGFIAGLGLGGLAFALAAKDTVSNIFGGIVIITDKPFSIGDWILTPSVEGTVEDINFRSTKVRTFGQALVTVPNSSLANESITNWSRMGKRRITFNLGVTYSTPKDKLEKCISEINKMLKDHPEIHNETIFVRFDSFGASSLDIFLYFFTNTTVWEEFLRVKEDVNFKIMEILETEGVSAAFPSTSVYFENLLETKKESMDDTGEYNQKN